MIYCLNDNLHEIELNDIDDNRLCFGFITMDDLRRNYKKWGMSENVILDSTSHSSNLRNTIDVYNNYSFGIINIININDILGKRDRLGFYIKKNLFLVVDIIDEDGSSEVVFNNAIDRIKDGKITIERVICSFIERLIVNDNKVLENMEYKISTLEDEITNEDIQKNFNTKMLIIKKKLLILRNYYMQLTDIVSELDENDNDIFDDESLRYFERLEERIERLESNSQILRESIVQLREAYQSALDYNLNSIMKVFTVVTTIFLPLTLIVGWYGMNFTNMPELKWKYGYLCVILLSISVVIVTIYYFKRKKLL